MARNRGAGEVVVDAVLNKGISDSFVVLVNTAQAASAAFSGTHGVGEHLPVQFRAGTAFVQINDLLPSEVLVLTNRP
jgi:hypothetical protein